MSFMSSRVGTLPPTKSSTLWSSSRVGSTMSIHKASGGIGSAGAEQMPFDQRLPAVAARLRPIDDDHGRAPPRAAARVFA